MNIDRLIITRCLLQHLFLVCLGEVHITRANRKTFQAGRGEKRTLQYVQMPIRRQVHSTLRARTVQLPYQSFPVRDDDCAVHCPHLLYSVRVRDEGATAIIIVAITPAVAAAATDVVPSGVLGGKNPRVERHGLEVLVVLDCGGKIFEVVHKVAEVHLSWVSKAGVDGWVRGFVDRAHKNARGMFERSMIGDI